MDLESESTKVGVHGATHAFGRYCVPSLAADGNFIAFHSNRNGTDDVFLYNRTKGKIVPLGGLNSTTASDRFADVAGDGRYVAFESDRADAGDVFVYDRVPSASSRCRV